MLFFWHESCLNLDIATSTSDCWSPFWVYINRTPSKILQNIMTFQKRVTSSFVRQFHVTSRDNRIIIMLNLIIVKLQTLHCIVEFAEALKPPIAGLCTKAQQHHISKLQINGIFVTITYSFIYYYPDLFQVAYLNFKWLN